jgi:TrmH family RNA methyltransferase
MPFAAPITSRSNARVKALRASFSGKASRPGEVVGIEGEHLIAEALRSGFELETVFLRQGSESVLQRPSLAGLSPAEVVVLSAAVFASAVDTGSPQGIAAMLKLREPSVKSSGPVLVLEDLQDPGNLGTLLRSAEAFGASRVMVTPGTVNQWNPKVMRASAGSVFRVAVVREPLQQIAAQLAQLEADIYAAVAKGDDAISLLATRFVADCALLVGNEGAGLSAEALALAQHRVHIPCAVESLNAAVAGSTLLYEAMRQREVAR